MLEVELLSTIMCRAQRISISAWFRLKMVVPEQQHLKISKLAILLPRCLRQGPFHYALEVPYLQVLRTEPVYNGQRMVLTFQEQTNRLMLYRPPTQVFIDLKLMVIAVVLYNRIR